MGKREKCGGTGRGAGLWIKQASTQTSFLKLPSSKHFEMSSATPDPPKTSKRKWDQPAPGEEANPVTKVAKTDEGKSASEAAAAAAAIAAKIAAQFSSGAFIGDAMKDHNDAEFTHDIDINDVRNRYLLTRGSTQDQVCLLSFSGLGMVLCVLTIYVFRFTKRLVHRLEQEVYGTRTDRKLQRKTPHCTFTFQPELRKCSTALWQKSTNLLLWTWGRWWKREIKRGNGCVSSYFAVLPISDVFCSGNGPKKSCPLDSSQYGTSTLGQRLSVPRFVQMSYSLVITSDVLFHRVRS